MNSINLPKNVTNAQLLALADPHEMWLVRVLFRSAHNQADYLVRGRNRLNRCYKAKYDPQLRCHTVDVPMSLWTANLSVGAYRDNESVMHDIMNGNARLTLAAIPLIVPFPGSESRHLAFADYVTRLEKREPGERKPTPKKFGIKRPGTPVNERMRKSRERKKLAKLALEEAAAAALLGTPASTPTEEPALA